MEGRGKIISLLILGDLKGPGFSSDIDYSFRYKEPQMVRLTT